MCSVMQTNIANYYCVDHSGTGKLKATLSRLSVCPSVRLSLSFSLTLMHFVVN